LVLKLLPGQPLTFSEGPPAVPDFSHLKRAKDVKREDIIAAAESRATCERFLDRLTAVAKPAEGGAVVLLLFSRIATVASEWLDGDLRIDLVADGAKTVLDVQSSLAEGLAERIFPRRTMNVPLLEFELAIARVPQMIMPLALVREPGKLRLTATHEVRSSTLPPSTDVDALARAIPKAPRVPVAVVPRRATAAVAAAVATEVVIKEPSRTPTIAPASGLSRRDVPDPAGATRPAKTEGAELPPPRPRHPTIPWDP
jgi:hypothetical protein